MIDTVKICSLIVLGYLFITQATVFAKDIHSPSYELFISFDTEKQQIYGTTRITIPANSAISLSVAELEVSGAFIRLEDDTEKLVQPVDNAFTFQPTPETRTVYISYHRQFSGGFSNLISDKGIALTHGWYPYPSVACLFNLSARLPIGFSAVTESDSFPLAVEDDQVKSSWDRLATNITFVAGPYETKRVEVRENLYVYTMFFPEDSKLSSGYLDSAAAYLKKHEQDIGPYPYNHFVVVANRLPTGYGLPSFTLIGQMVLRLPFIKTSSLGHEIVHSWFGNEVGVDYKSGNWSEGLTSFLADHTYRAQEGKGVEDRKASLVKYHSYVSQEQTELMTLKNFRSASHNQPMAEVKRAVGYNAGAFFFHELRTLLGEVTFNKGIRDFYKNNRRKAASWEDLQVSFERVSDQDLNSFFQSRLTMTKAPRIEASDISISTKDGISLNFTLSQKGNEVVPLTIPIHVTTGQGDIVFLEQLTLPEKKVSLSLASTPLSFTLDPEYTILRQLEPEERPAVWSQFLGAGKNLLVVTSEAEQEKFQDIIKSLKKYKPEVLPAKKVTNQMLSENNLLFLGTDQQPCRSIFGKVLHNSGSLTVDVRKNPLDPDLVAVMISENRNNGSPSVARRLSHYGKYSLIEFTGDGSVKTATSESANGIHYRLERLPVGGSTSDTRDFDAIIDELITKRVIYLGETHTSLPDHLLQLRVIEALYKRDPKLAIGMEMFPSSSQKSLDDFTAKASDMTEKTFLKQSNYFNVWGYDYRLFRDILSFARDKNLPLRGLNLDRKIVSDVFRAGNTDSLSKEVKDKLVKDRSLDLPGYQERLNATYNMHVTGQHAQGGSSGFIQSQALWDETMAENIATFINDNPDYRMVVIAGSQHTRKDSGIPPRVAARVAVNQASLINIYDGVQPSNLRQVADYFFLSDMSELPPTGKIGLVLSEESDTPGLTISQISPHGKAGEAGVEEGDILIRLDDNDIVDMADLRIAMIDARAGDTIELEVIRGQDTDKRYTFEVELTTPKMNRPHP